MSTESEKQLGLSEREEEVTRKILTDLFPHLVPNDWVLVGGLPFRYYYLMATEKAWVSHFNDLDLISNHKTVLLSSVSKDFYIGHHHPAGNEGIFYFQILHKQFPQITIDIFGDPIPNGEEFIKIKLLGLDVKIPTREEMYLFKLRDVLLLVPLERGLPPKFVEQLRFLEDVIDTKKAESLWQKRHQETPNIESIYQFDSLVTVQQKVKDVLASQKRQIKIWTKSDPLKPCSGCVVDSKFPLWRNIKANDKAVFP